MSDPLSRDDYRDLARLYGAASNGDADALLAAGDLFEERGRDADAAQARGLAAEVAAADYASWWPFYLHCFATVFRDEAEAECNLCGRWVGSGACPLCDRLPYADD